MPLTVTYPRVIPLAPQDAAYGLATHKIIVDYLCLVARGGASTAATIQLLPGQTPSQAAADSAPTGTCPAGTTVRFAGFRLNDGFVGPSITNLTVIVGDGNDDNRFVVAKELATAGTEILNWAETATTQPYAYPIADGIDAIFTATGANLNVLTAGEVEIYLHISQPPVKAR